MARNVLIADDVPYVRKELSALLKKNHYKVLGEAGSGTEAVYLQKKLNPDIITMDVVMPDMSGIEAVRKILKDSPGARIIMISGLAEESLIMESINAGAKDFIIKPFRPEHVIKTIGSVLTGDLRLADRLLKK